MTRERDGACGRCRGAEALLAMEKTFAPSMEGHLTKHWDGDDKVGGAHQTVTDADKKSDDAGLSPAAAAAATASAGLFGTRVGRLTRGRLNLTQVRRQQTTVWPTRRKKTKRVFGLAYTYG